MKAVLLLPFLLVPVAVSAQESDRDRRILDRVEKELRESRIRLREEIRAIIREEVRRASRKGEAPAAPRGEKPAPKPAAKKKVRLGIVVDDFPEAERKERGVAGGMKIVDVREPARGAGVRPGDILLEIDGRPVTEGTILSILARHAPGDEVDLTVLRDGKRRKLPLVLAEREE